MLAMVYHNVLEEYILPRWTYGRMSIVMGLMNEWTAFTVHSPISPILQNIKFVARFERVIS